MSDQGYNEWLYRKEAAANIDRQLRDMEGDFLQALADHQAEGGAVPAASTEEPDVDTISILVEVARPDFEGLFEALIHVLGHNCEAGSERLLKFGGALVHALGFKAAQNGWMDEEDQQ